MNRKLSIIVLGVLAATAARADSPSDIKSRWESWRASGQCTTDSDCVASLARFNLSDEHISADGPELQAGCRDGDAMACDYLAALWPELSLDVSLCLWGKPRLAVHRSRAGRPGYDAIMTIDPVKPGAIPVFFMIGQGKPLKPQRGGCKGKGF